MLISLALAPIGHGGWHIMPVVDGDTDKLILLCSVSPDGKASLLKLPKAELVRIHDSYPGGDEVAFLDQY